MNVYFFIQVSPVGVYKSKWEVLANGELAFEVVVPFGGTAYLTLSFAPDSIKDTFETVVETKDGYEVMLEAGSVAVCEIRQGNELAFRLVWEFMNRWCHN